MEARKIINEFGHYVGVAVVELEIIADSQAMGNHDLYQPQPVMRIIRKWIGQDEEIAFALAEGFCEGMETPRSINPEPIADVSSGSNEVTVEGCPYCEDKRSE